MLILISVQLFHLRQFMLKYLNIVVAISYLVFSTSLWADCRTQLEAIDKRLADSSNAQLPMLQGLRLMRDQGENFCKSGDEIRATDAFNSISAMLKLFESNNTRPQAAIQSTKQKPVAAVEALPTLEEMVRDAAPQSSLTPYVVVTKSAAVAN